MNEYILHGRLEGGTSFIHDVYIYMYIYIYEEWVKKKIGRFEIHIRIDKGFRDPVTRSNIFIIELKELINNYLRIRISFLFFLFLSIEILFQRIQIVDKLWWKFRRWLPTVACIFMDKHYSSGFYKPSQCLRFA